MPIIRLDSSVTVDLSLRGRAQSQGILVGATARNTQLSETSYANTLKAEFSLLTPENELKMKSLQPTQGNFTFTPADALVSFALTNGMKVRGHTLVWDLETPLWAIDPGLTVPQIMTIFQTHITTVLNHYAGKIYAWDVANESLQPSPSGALRTTWVTRLGSDAAFKTLLASAFIWARAADPTARLFMSEPDWQAVGSTHGDAFYALVQELISMGAPIDGVALHSHVVLDDLLALGSSAWKPALAAGIARMTALGLDFNISELDIRITLPVDGTDLADQALAYSDILDVVLSAQRASVFNMWGFTDKYSWIPASFPGYGAALIFDSSYLPKPAYTSLANRLVA